MRKYLIIIVALVSILSGCKGYRDISIGNIELEKFKLTSASKVDVVIGVDVFNPTKANFTLINVDGVLFRNDVPFANLSLLKDVYIPTLHNGKALVNCRIELLDPMAVLVMGLNIKSWNMDEFRIKLKATVKKGAFKKSFKINNIPLDKVIKKIKLTR
ncbi:MAG: hypothetical protein RSE02_05565 [Bacteroidales bacterium]